jgi:hypothetical protein
MLSFTPLDHLVGDLLERLNFISERAVDACSTYGVESISLSAVKQI